MPITSWKEVGRVVGKSTDALLRVRKKFGDQTLEPWFRDEEAVLSWFERLIAPPAAPQKRRKREPQADIGAAVDPREVARSLRAGGVS